MNKELLITGMPVTLSLLAMYLTYQNPDDYIDTLTGMFGREAFLITVQDCLFKKKEMTLIVLDLNDFKNTNHLFGLKGGDDLIVQISEYLMSVLPKRYLYRIDGDRFGILVDSNVESTILNIKKRFSNPWRVNSTNIRVLVTICKIPIVKFAENIEDVMAIVESSVLYAKKIRKGTYLEVDKQVIDSFHRRQQIEKALRHAIEADLLEVYFQPIYSVYKERVNSAEALLRLYDPELGFIPPDEFIVVAEQTGLIHRVGEIVIEKTCEFIEKNELWKYGIDVIDINLSTVQCMQSDLVDRILAITKQYHFDLSMLNFEITESAAVTSDEQLLFMMNKLMEHGITFSMDDYGKGYSNSDSIIRFPFHMIKLDKSILWNSVKSNRAYVILQNTVNMMKELKLHIIAEGAETKEHIDLLQKIGINYIQGFYYSKPLPKEQFMEYIASLYKKD